MSLVPLRQSTELSVKDVPSHRILYKFSLFLCYLTKLNRLSVIRLNSLDAGVYSVAWQRVNDLLEPKTAMLWHYHNKLYESGLCTFRLSLARSNHSLLVTLEFMCTHDMLTQMHFLCAVIDILILRVFRNVNPTSYCLFTQMSLCTSD